MLRDTHFMHALVGFGRSHCAFQAIFISNTPAAFPGLINKTRPFINLCLFYFWGKFYSYGTKNAFFQLIKSTMGGFVIVEGNQ